MPSSSPTSCFLVCPIGDPESETRRRSDHWADYIVRPALKEAGYEQIVRADEIAKPGEIAHQIIDHLREDDLVVADLTDSNPNVFYELALRHVAQKPVIQFKAPGAPLPFDVKGLRAIEYVIDDLQAADQARKLLGEHLAEVEKDAGRIGTDSPVGGAMRFGELVATGQPDLARLVEAVESMRAQIAAMRPQPILYAGGFTGEAGAPTFASSGSFDLGANVIRNIPTSYMVEPGRFRLVDTNLPEETPNPEPTDKPKKPTARRKRED